MRRTYSFEKTLMLGKVEGQRKRGWPRMRWLDGITDSWTWVWVGSRSWYWTGKPGVLQSMESQRIRHDWATELNWTELNVTLLKVLQWLFSLMELSANPQTQWLKPLLIWSACTLPIRPPPFHAAYSSVILNSLQFPQWDPRTPYSVTLHVHTLFLAPLVLQLAGHSYSFQDQLKQALSQDADPKLPLRRSQLLSQSCSHNPTLCFHFPLHSPPL